MNSKRAKRILRIVFFGTLAVALVTLVTMHLWNHLLTAIFGWPRISFFQTLGLLILSKIFFGGFRGPRPGMHWRRRMMERWEQMTPEEREKFREGMRGRCGPFGPPSEPKS